MQGARRALGLVLVGMLGCARQTAPTVSDSQTAEERALITIATAFSAGDCATVERLAPGFSTTQTHRFEAVTTWYGRCRLLALDYQGAVDLLEPVAAGGSKYAADALYFWGRARYGQAAYDAAAARFEAYTSRFPHGFRRANAWFYWGRALARLKQPAEALAAFEHLMTMGGVSESRQASAVYHAAKAHAALAVTPDSPHWAAAAALFSRILADFSGSRYSDNAAYGLAKIPYGQGDFVAAEAALSAFVKRYPASSWRPLALYYEARSVHRQGDLDRALGLYEQYEAAFADQPLADNARYYQGRVRYDQAVAAQVAGAPPEAFYGQAVVVFESALADFPQTSLATSIRYFLGRCRYELGDYAGAVSPLERAGEDLLSIWADNAAYYAGRAHYRLAGASGPAEFDQALDWFDLVLAQWPASQYADNARYFGGRAYYKTARFADARDAFAALVADYPSSAYVDNALYYQALSELRLGDCAAAKVVIGALAGADLGGYLPKAQQQFELACPGGAR